MENEIISMPVVLLRGMTIIPNTTIHFDISRVKSIKAVKTAMKNEQKILLLTQKDPEIKEPKESDLFGVGTIVQIQQLIKLPQNVIRVLVKANIRAKVHNIECNSEYYYADVEEYNEFNEKEYNQIEVEALRRSIKEILNIYLVSEIKTNKSMLKQLLRLENIDVLIDRVIEYIPLHYLAKQELLEIENVLVRGENLLGLLTEELEIYRTRNELQEKVKKSVDKNQKDYLLREQLKVIREELGETNVSSEADEYMEKLDKLDISPESKEKIAGEIKRYRSMANSSTEGLVVKSYLDTVLNYPWNNRTKERFDIIAVKKILNRDHFGLEKVKERILEFLAVEKLSRNGDKPIICLLGPPGTGKTSIAKSIANAINKKYVRISLGGVRDEAEIRGHRKTYIGAMPGRIVQEIKQVKVCNPLILLDEIDKVGKDQRGDTASALLEVLDSEQNSSFLDHYMEIPIDLSGVMFIATANDLSDIPRPLIDRMEIIEIAGYTENEKVHIAMEHIINKQIKKNGLTKRQLKISEDAVVGIIRKYTREAGVRGLERNIAGICRKTAKLILEEEIKTAKVTEKNLQKYLGPEKVHDDKEDLQNQIGIVRGLAWTSVGGDTLSIEVNVMPGKGIIELTGRLGDVMKESAKAGISYIRSISERYYIGAAYFDKHDIHIHIPEGAVPKDGPSAGITMATAVLSAITNQYVRGNIAMTGEITLRGRVLPIGGLKEKLLAAKAQNVVEVLVPSKNKKDVAELDTEITSGLIITYVDTMDDVISHAIVEEN